MIHRLIALALMVVVIAGCQSELNTDLPVNPQSKAPHTTDPAELATFAASAADPKACLACHTSGFPSPHPAGFVVFSSADFHGKVLRNGNFALMSSSSTEAMRCSNCHGTELKGGWSQLSCSGSGCHVEADGGPKACYTCHGDYVSKVAYPTTPSFHKTHVLGGLGSEVKLDCASCHTMPSSYDDPMHIDGTPGAEVVFNNALAATVTKGTIGVPSFDNSSSSCANTYCHGNFTNGNNATVSYAQPNAAACGTCHGNPVTGNPLPKAPHPQVETCATCHPTVVDANKNIIDKKLHINGKLNVFTSERTDW